MSLMLVLQVLRRRIWIVALTFLATLSGALIVLAVVPSRYDAVATASIDPTVSDPVNGQTVGMAMGIIQGNLMALAKSNQVAISVVKRLGMDSDPASQARYRSSSASGLLDIQQWLATQLLDHVDPKFAMGSNVLSITYKGSAPQQAALVANAFMAAFIDAAIAQKGTAALKASSWYAPQMDKIRQDLADSRERLARFQLESKLVAPTGASNSDNMPLTSVTGDLSKAKADLVALQTQFDTPIQTAASSTEGQNVDTQTLISLRSSLSALDAEIAKMQTEVGAKNPRLLEKFAARQSLQQQMQTQLDDFRKKLKDRIAAKADLIAKLEKARTERVGDMINVQGQREQLAALERDVKFHQEELERIQKAASQSRQESQLSFSNIALLDNATPPLAVAFPKPTIALGMAVVLGLGLGALLALLAEALDRRVRAGDDIEFIANAPLLGVMPSIRPNQPGRWRQVVTWLRIAAPRGRAAAKS